MAASPCRCISILFLNCQGFRLTRSASLLIRTTKRLLYTTKISNEGEKKGNVVVQNNNEISDVNNEEEDLLQSICNKSGLRERHYCEMHKTPPPVTEDENNIMPLWLYRKRFGKYGEVANINLKSLWPSTEEMIREEERESLEFPYTVQEMILKAKKEKSDHELQIIARQNKIQENMKNLDKWIYEVKERKRKKEMEALLALEKKKQQIEEVRQIFGYSISPHDERFQEALDKKIEEDKKRLKKEQKLKKQQEFLEKLRADAETQMKDALIGKPITEGQDVPPTK